MLALPAIGIAIRRLHDLDYTGWFVLIGLIPFLGLAFVIVLGCLPGNAGENRFGPDPLGHEPQAAPNPERSSGLHQARPLDTVQRDTVQRDVVGEIERLARLKASGALSETEFEVMKAQALGQNRRA